jgi:hypothetical protein
MSEIERIKLSDKSTKASPKITDKLFLLDLEDLKDGVPKVKQVEVGNLPFGTGGGGAPYVTNVIRVEPTASADETGKLYRTYANALAFIKAQPPTTGLWAIELPSGNFAENIELNKDIMVFGHNTTITGVISSTILYDIGRSDGSASGALKENKAYIQGCILRSLDLSAGAKLITNDYQIVDSYNIDKEVAYYEPATGDFIGYYKSLQNDNIGNAPDSSPSWWEQIDNDIVGLPILFTKDCFYELLSFVKPPSLPCCIVNVDSQINSGDFTGMCILINIGGVIVDGSFPEVIESFDDFITFFSYNTKIFGGELNCGQILGCMIQNTVFNAGKYEIMGCPQIHDSEININKDSVIFGCSMDRVDIFMDGTDEYTLKFIKNLTDHVELEYLEDSGFQARLMLTSNTDIIDIIHSSFSNLTISYTGDYYDNTTSGLSATEMQSAIDELKSLIGGGTDSFFEYVANTLYSSEFIKFKDPVLNRGGISLDRRYGGGGFSPILYESLSIFGASNMGGARSIFTTGKYGYNISGCKFVALADAYDYYDGGARTRLVIRGDVRSIINYFDIIGLNSSGTHLKSEMLHLNYDPATDTTEIITMEVVSATNKQVILFFIDANEASNRGNITDGDYNLIVADENKVSGINNTVLGYSNKVVGAYNTLSHSNSSEVQGIFNFISSLSNKIFRLESIVSWQTGMQFIVDCPDYTELALNSTYRLISFAYDPVTKIIKHDDEFVKLSALPLNNQVVLSLANEQIGFNFGSQIRNFYDPFYGYVNYISFLVEIGTNEYINNKKEAGLQIVKGILNFVVGEQSEVTGLLNDCYADGAKIRGCGNHVSFNAKWSETTGIDGHNWIPTMKVLSCGRSQEVGDRQSMEIVVKGSSTKDDEYGVILKTSANVFGESIESPISLPQQETAWKFVIEVMGIYRSDMNSIYYAQTIKGIIINGEIKAIDYETPQKDCPLTFGVTVEMAEFKELKIRCTNVGEMMYNPVEWIANVKILQLINVYPY